MGFFAVLSNNTRGTYPNFISAILFSVDGKIDYIYNPNGSYNTLIVPFLSTNSLSQNINTFIQAINNPFLWMVNIPAVPALPVAVSPAAYPYFLRRVGLLCLVLIVAVLGLLLPVI